MGTQFGSLQIEKRREPKIPLTFTDEQRNRSQEKKLKRSKPKLEADRIRGVWGGGGGSGSEERGGGNSRLWKWASHWRRRGCRSPPGFLFAHLPVRIADSLVSGLFFRAVEWTSLGERNGVFLRSPSIYCSGQSRECHLLGQRSDGFYCLL